MAEPNVVMLYCVTDDRHDPQDVEGAVWAYTSTHKDEESKTLLQSLTINYPTPEMAITGIDTIIASLQERREEFKEKLSKED